MRRSASMLLFAALGLGACTSTEQAPDPSAITPPQSAAPGQSPIQTTAIPSAARVQLAPIVGATVEAATPLTERIAAKASERGITLVGGGDPSTTLMLKGYFSALTEGRETTVIYVWDVLDASGNRLHRIQGQMKAPARRREGWDSVSNETMQEVADQTIDQLATWLSTRAG
jgi:hypothetical protein